jgi:hypothetical protein
MRLGGRKMKKRHPIVSGLVTLGYMVGGVVALLFLIVAVIVIFFNQSDEAWNAGVTSWFLIALFALPVSVLLAIGSYFKAQMRVSETEAHEELPNKRPEGTEGKCPPSKHSQPPSVPHP